MANQPTNQPTNQPKISFIVPIYNVKDYLSDCLDSILSQNIKKEVVLINDGSTDGSLDIALDYASKYPFITLVSQHNKGLSSARNIGIRLAKGEYILFVDSDDVLVGNHFPQMMALAEKLQPDLVRFNAEIVYINGKSTPVPPLTISPQYQTTYEWPTLDVLSTLVKRDWIPGVCWTLIKRSFLQKMDLTFYEGINAEDQLFYVQLLTLEPNAKLLEYPATIYHYKRRPNSIVLTPSSNYFNNHAKVIQLIDNYVQTSQLIQYANMRNNIRIIFEQLRNNAAFICARLPTEEQQIAKVHWEKELKNIFEYYDLPLFLKR